MSAGARRDRRGLGLLLTAGVVLAGGLWFARMEPTHAPAAPAPAGQSADELQRRFDAAVVLLHARRYEPAATALARVIELAPQLPEAQANMGFALLGLQRHPQARARFERAIELRAGQANAYYGLALAHEAGGDLELARGAMRSYLHLARAESEVHLRRARAALWEWETQLEPRGGAPAR